MNAKLEIDRESLMELIEEAVNNCLISFNYQANAPLNGLLNKKQAAKKLGISLGSLENIIKSGKLTKVQLGKSVRIDEDDLKKYIEMNKRSRTSVATKLGSFLE